MTTSMTTQDNPRKLSKKEFNQIYWRSFTLLGSFNYERMEGLGFLVRDDAELEADLEG